MKILAESSFLIACCHVQDSIEDEKLAEFANSVKDWDEVVETAAANGIASLVLGKAKSLSDRGMVPDDVVARLRSIAVSETVRVFMLRSALTRILEAFQKNGITIMILKGASLSPLYGESWVRPSSDIDLLCKEGDYPKVQEALISLGYLTDDVAGLPERHSHNETLFERHFLSEDKLVHIELHVDGIKLGVRPRHTDSIWTRAIPIDVDGFPALALCPENQIMMLSAHLHRHGFSRLIWFKDIDLIIRRYNQSLNWEQIMSEARGEGAESSLWYTLNFLRKMLDTPIPQSVMDELAPKKITRWMYNRVWPESDVLNLHSRTKRRAVQFSASESWRGMIPSLILMGRRREKLSIMFKRLLSP